MTRTVVNFLTVVAFVNVCVGQEQLPQLIIEADGVISNGDVVVAPVQPMAVEATVLPLPTSPNGTPPNSTPMQPGKTVETDTVVSVGTRLVAEWQGKWLA